MRLSKFLIQKAQLEAGDSKLLLYSDQVMGNGVTEGLMDIVYVKPDAFERGLTVQIASEVERINRSLRESGKKYLLIGFGRWGSSERWLGIPVTWGQISSAAAIVESTLPEIDVDPSQGSHFFHNIEAFQVSYFCISHNQKPPLDWEWLSEQHLVEETETVRHVETQQPITVKVDGSTGRGAVWHD